MRLNFKDIKQPEASFEDMPSEDKPNRLRTTFPGAKDLDTSTTLNKSENNMWKAVKAFMKQTLPDIELAKQGKATSGARATAHDQSGLSSASPLLTTSAHQGEETATGVDENNCYQVDEDDTYSWQAGSTNATSVTGEEYGVAEEFEILLSNDEILKPYYHRAVQKIDAIIFRKEFLTLLNRFTIDLQANSRFWTRELGS